MEPERWGGRRAGEGRAARRIGREAGWGSGGLGGRRGKEGQAVCGEQRSGVGHALIRWGKIERVGGYGHGIDDVDLMATTVEELDLRSADQFMAETAPLFR